MIQRQWLVRPPRFDGVAADIIESISPMVPRTGRSIWVETFTGCGDNGVIGGLTLWRSAVRDYAHIVDPEADIVVPVVGIV